MKGVKWMKCSIGVAVAVMTSIHLCCRLR